MDKTGSQRYALSRSTRSLLAALGSCAAIALFHFTFSGKSEDSSNVFSGQGYGLSDTMQNVGTSTVPASGAVTASGLQSEHETLPRLPLTAVALSAATQDLLDRGGIAWTRQQLLAQATQAVIAGDDHALAKILSELGELSLIEADIDTAEMYLAESLDLFAQQENELAQAGVYMQLGRLHLLVRKRARVASNAYDTLLISRWKISHGQFYSAEPDLLRVVDNNLKLERYGAAASTYATLYRGYLESGSTLQARDAGIEAIKLYASSGRIFDAQALRQKMISQGTDSDVFDTLAPELEELQRQFEDSVKAMGAARDQEQLYNQLQARGDVVNAWRFRQKANATLARATKRAQYRSQPDVLAELYRSNRSMENATESLSRANALYYEYGFDTTDLKHLQSEVY